MRLGDILSRRWWQPALVVVSIATVVLAIHMLALAASVPIVRRFQYAAPDWPAGTPPLRIVLLTDIHVHNLGRSRDRLGRIVAQVNAFAPDIVLIAGDLVGGGVQDRPASTTAALAPLDGLHPRLATVAVLGNHDHWSEPQRIRAALVAHGVTVLDNRATRVGPLTVGGVDDMLTHHGNVAAVLRSMGSLPGPHLLLSHGPEPFADRRVDGLVLAGHTHCGQVVLPLLGAIAPMRTVDRRYLCGVYREPGRTLLVSAGTGTSRLPIRLGVSPEIWVITMGGANG